ncbi:hypothetical protein [Commensalibacter communis]|uniref:hypothetical protein n=1 Tax=Commensalibacter communis TaxID=2972786 RepID=UPI00232DB0B6|nr:hypothetical protein [Commensalibacter communis]
MMWSSGKFERQFYSYFSKNCNKRNFCIVELHKITNFKWDHAYIFTKKSKNLIQQIIKKEFSISSKKLEIIFIKNDKVIATGVFDLFDDFNVADRPKNYLNIRFITYQSDLQSSQNRIKNTYSEVSYYDLQPNNDKLAVNYNDLNISGTMMSWGYNVSPTNIQ